MAKNRGIGEEDLEFGRRGKSVTGVVAVVVVVAVAGGGADASAFGVDTEIQKALTKQGRLVAGLHLGESDAVQRWRM